MWTWQLDHKEGWVPKNWCFQTVVLEKTLESPLDSKEIQPGNQHWIFIGRLMLKLKLQYFGHLMRRIDSLEKTLMLGETGGGEGDDRGWHGWMASPTRWKWVWATSRSRDGQGSLVASVHEVTKIGHDLVMEQQHSSLVFHDLGVYPSLMKTPHCFEYCAFVETLDLGKCVSSFFNIILAIQGPL